MNWVPVILVCWVLACFVFVVWFCVLFGFVLCVFAVCLVYDDDGPMDYVQVLPQFSFAALNSRWPGTLICNYCSCNVIQCGKRPGERHYSADSECALSAFVEFARHYFSARLSCFAWCVVMVWLRSSLLSPSGRR